MVSRLRSKGVLLARVCALEHAKLKRHATIARVKYAQRGLVMNVHITSLWKQ